MKTKIFRDILNLTQEITRLSPFLLGKLAEKLDITIRSIERNISLLKENVGTGLSLRKSRFYFDRKRNLSYTYPVRSIKWLKKQCKHFLKKKGFTFNGTLSPAVICGAVIVIKKSMGSRSLMREYF